jgi:hypothetical protein
VSVWLCISSLTMHDFNRSLWTSASLHTCYLCVSVTQCVQDYNFKSCMHTTEQQRHSEGAMNRKKINSCLHASRTFKRCQYPWTCQGQCAICWLSHTAYIGFTAPICTTCTLYACACRKLDPVQSDSYFIIFQSDPQQWQLAYMQPDVSSSLHAHLYSLHE